MSKVAAEPIHVRLGHSPDADDIFMWWPLAGTGDQPAVIDTAPFCFQLVPADIEELNVRAETGELEVTGISMAHYPAISKDYALTTCGSSFGLGYGPKLVAQEPMSVEELQNHGGVIGVAGMRTSGYAAARLLLGDHNLSYLPMAFEEIPDAVCTGQVDAGVVIHEGQLTYMDSGLHLVSDLGQWWQQHSGGPLPLGGNVIRRDLDERWGPGASARIVSLLRQSIAYSMANRHVALDKCLAFEQGDHQQSDRRQTIDRFVELYVNQLTLDLGDVGRQAIGQLLNEMAGAGFAPAVAEVAFVDPEEA